MIMDDSGLIADCIILVIEYHCIMYNRVLKWHYKSRNDISNRELRVLINPCVVLNITFIIGRFLSTLALLHFDEGFNPFAIDCPAILHAVNHLGK